MDIKSYSYRSFQAWKQGARISFTSEHLFEIQMKTLLGFSVKIEHISYMIMIACFFLISGVALIIYDMNFHQVKLKKLIWNFVLKRNLFYLLYFRNLRFFNLSYLFKRPKTMRIFSFRKNLSIFVREYQRFWNKAFDFFLIFLNHMKELVK